MTTSHKTAPSRRRSRGVPPQRRGGSRRRASGGRGGRTRARTTLVMALSLVVLGTAGLGWLYLKLNGNINTFGADGLSSDRPEAGSSKGENVLVIGSDARVGGNDALGGGSKDDIGRSDTAFLLHVYADHRHALAVSIPRDTLVTIPACKLPDGGWTEPQPNTMFNAAYSVGNTAEGNPACSQNTVEHLTGLRVDHTVVVDFKGFAALTDVVGGVPVCVPQDVYQKDLNPNRATRGSLLFAKGEQTVAGQQALDWVRIRHGIGDGSDIGRIKRQQAFVAGLIKKVKADGFTPTKLFPLADAATKSLTVDPGLGSADKLLSFAMSLKDVDLHNTKFVTIPWRYEGARVAIVEPDASELWAALRADRTIDGKDAGGKKSKKSKEGQPGASESPEAGQKDLGKGIDVGVYNGTTTPGLATRGASVLTGRGFTVTGTGNAGSQNHATTLIQYGPGRQAEAETVTKLFPGAELQALTGPGINVVLGEDFTAAADGASAEPTSVPTSVAADARSADDDLCSNLSYG
ncbi:LCP family protein [Streptomyces sp. NPDC057596]|uniref:LCP family protein n=1 Tax=Streptomyces sp. NPDC057596 TaxID=3346178 RepID=UPI00367FD9A1